jgi:3',5'-cyclic AMP phosphodiesterase CpdA
VVRYVTAAAPDLVIHLGDLSLDGAGNRADLDHGRRQLDLLPVPWRAIPGNHDVGDNPRPGGPDRLTVTDARRRQWLEAVGPDHWSLTLAGWRLLAVNAQLAGSDLAAEAAQWSWLAGEVAQVGPGQQIAILTHKPLTAPEAELAAAPPHRFWPPAARDRLAGLFDGQPGPPALIVSGHVHQSRELRIGGTDHLWVPTTWAVLPDHAQQAHGTKRCGVVSLTFAPGLAPRPSFHQPDGIRQLTITVDFPDPYRGR